MGAGAEESRGELEQRLAFLEQDPDNPHLLREASDLAIRAGEFERAAALLDRAQQRYPNDTGFRFQRATLALAQGEFADAEMLLAVVLDGGEDHPAIRYNLAVARQQLRDFEGVRECLQGFSENDWQSLPQANIVYARAMHHLGDLDAGRTRLQDHLASHPEDGEACGVLALLCYDAGDAEAAEDVARKALELKPNSAEALMTLGGLALDKQDADAALAHMEEAVRLHPGHGRAWSGLAFARMLDLELDQAYENFLKAVELMPNHIGTWHGLAWLQILRDDFSGAAESLEKAMAIDRNFSETHGGLAVVAVLDDRLDDAKPMIERALRLDRQSFSARFAQSLMLVKRGNQSLASAIIDKMAESSQLGGKSGLQEMVANLIARKMDTDDKKAP